MNRHFIALCVALVASTKVYGYSADNGYQHQSEAVANADVGEYQLQTGSSASSGASANGADSAAALYGSGQNIAYKPVNSRANSVSSYISYPNNKGEILIHRPAAIIVKRPPTKVVVNHPPLVVKPAPVVLHKPPAVIVRKVFVKHHPRPVKVEPVYVNVVKPPAEKYFVNEKQQANYAPQGSYAPVSVNADFAPINGIGSGALAPNGASTISGSTLSGAGYAGSDVESAVANAGYRLLQNNQGLAALANLSGSGGSAYDTDLPSHSSYSAPSY